MVMIAEGQTGMPGTQTVGWATGDALCRNGRHSPQDLPACCPNAAAGKCHPEIHQIIGGMAGNEATSVFKSLYTGTLFPVFENEECDRYVRQYLLPHMPQIECALQSGLKSEQDWGTEEWRMLDLCSGPGTVFLALLSLRKKGILKKNVCVDTYEPSMTFNERMKSCFPHALDAPVRMGRHYSGRLEDAADVKSCPFDQQYNWIVVANGIEPLFKGGDVRAGCDNVATMLTRFVQTGRPCLFTAIEGRCGVGSPPADAFQHLIDLDWSRFGLEHELVEQIPLTCIQAPRLQGCRFFTTKRQVFSPYVRAVTLKLSRMK